MITPNEHLTALNQASVKTAVGLANTALNGAENLVNTQIKITKNLIEDGIENAKALSSLKDSKALAEMPGTLAEPNLQKALSYSRSMYEVVSQTQAELTKLVEDYVGEVNKSVVSALDKAAKTAPAGAGADAVVTAMKSILEASAASYESMSKATKQVANFAEASLTAAASKAVSNVSKK